MKIRNQSIFKLKQTNRIGQSGILFTTKLTNNVNKLINVT